MPLPPDSHWKPIGTYRSCPLPFKTHPYTAPPQRPPLTPDDLETLTKRLYKKPAEIKLPESKMNFAFGRSF